MHLAGNQRVLPTRRTDDASVQVRHGKPEPPSYQVRYADGNSRVEGPAPPQFTFLLRDPAQFEWLQRVDLYGAATAFIRGDFDVQGDIVAAMRFKRSTARLRVRDVLAKILAQFAPGRLEAWFQSHGRAARNIRFHYDRSNDFYGTFLDPKMVYSCAYFRSESDSLEEAQTAKMDHICRKLDLHEDQSFLDIGCGWGGLVIHAAEKYLARATGCTLSLHQEFFASKIVLEKKLSHRVNIRDCDYRSLRGTFDKIASVGMFEHVGRRRLHEYFSKVFNLLEDRGLFLNHGIIRPEGMSDGPETLFLQRKVFPGGELATLSAVLRAAGDTGFEVLDVENLRPHYELTCRHWVNRLRASVDQCQLYVDPETYRTWLLYLAASALSFESATTDIYQVLMAKRRPTFAGRRLTRDYMYG